MPEPHVCIILLNYNRGEDTIECIDSLLKCTYASFHIIVIDNASTDNSAEIVSKNFPAVAVLQTGRNLGYTGGVNFGIRQARQTPAEYILVLNNDTLVEPDFLTHLVEAMENDRNAALAGGTIYCEHERTKIWYAGGHLVPWRGLAVHEEKHQLVEPSTLNGVRQVTFVTGCMTLFRASLLEAIGWEDERFFMYLDDIELSARILAKGYRLLYVPQAIIYHKVLGEKESAFKLYYSARNRLLLIKTAFGGWPRFIALPYFLAVIITKLLVWRFTNPRFYKAAMYGLRDFFAGRFYEGRGLTEFATHT